MEVYYYIKKYKNIFNSKEKLIIKFYIKVKNPGFRFLSNHPHTLLTKVYSITASDLAFQKLPKMKGIIHIEIKYTTDVYKKNWKEKYQRSI